MGQVRFAAVVIPFPAERARRAGAAADGERRGEILLFTGVRYERMPEPDPEPVPATHGRSARRRRRSA